ncbi:Putative Zn(2)-C6 fungal-type DNA-bindingFT domain protein [Lichtheimia ramosa]|uniref:Putative Zn(2)-C6 fungal-type DNA-bindingFT domain protein n=1 Tax=Lichtheimia ramosa TaxID=688394 RepID=A0A077WKP5_9FUNG|nr:Putative Zn(2)-C6 fungal-type DNA-bindingFT domain protein [Lichtheimia ramosa]
MDSNSTMRQEDTSNNNTNANQGIPSTNQESTPDSTPSQDTTKKKKTGPKRRKVTHACVYCRRSHMTCDEGRPCQRCIKRSIGHLCHDEPKHSNNSAQNKNRTTVPTTTTTSAPGYMPLNSLGNGLGGNSNLGGLPIQFFGQMGTGQLTFASEHMGNEISVISNFLDSLDGDVQTMYGNNNNNNNQQSAVTTPTVNTTEKFFLTAADPSDGKLEDRLTEVINAKYEAGFLKPYNYVNGYARLQKYMDNNMSASSRQRILNVMGTFRPAFRSVAQSLTDIDLILVEEAFERLLLDYDRVFSSMGIPACLWRRTGEIYKGNKEFASLVNVPIENLREGRLCIYELMAEESAVNYWEKYGNIAFDPGQKAVLTSCLLKNPDPDNTSVISCCFSFTIRRDKYNIPTVIVGNFLPVRLQ